MTVTIPWDAKSQFLPPLQFLARSLASGQSPFWTPNIFGGWPLISDPQSLAFSALHFLLTYFDPAPSFRAVDSLTFAYLLFGGIGIILYFRDHPVVRWDAQIPRKCVPGDTLPNVLIRFAKTSRDGRRKNNSGCPLGSFGASCWGRGA